MEASAEVESQLVACSGVLAAGGTRKSRAWWVIVILCRLLLGAVFLYAGIEKARTPSAFANDIHGFQLLPEVLVMPLAIYLPFLEILVGMGLISGVAYSGALVITGGMLTGFILALASAMWRGLEISCGCFGDSGGGTDLTEAILRDALLLVVWSVLVWHFSHQGADRR